MGTRSLIRIKEGNKTLVTIYNQYDGYPTGMGDRLANLVGNTKIVNGYGGGMQLPHHANGLACLAAYIISELKEGIGNCYIIPTSPANKEEYNYTLTEKSGIVHVKLVDWENKVLYSGPLKHFNGETIEQSEAA